MSARVNLGKSDPALYKSVVQLDGLAAQAAQAAGIPDGLTHLIRLRASQINGCAFCARMHTRDALACGETMDRVSVLPAWRETTYFDARESAALALVEAITLISDGQLSEQTYAQAAEALTEAEISAIEWLAIVINAWNRIAIASRYAVHE